MEKICSAYLAYGVAYFLIFAKLHIHCVFVDVLQKILNFSGLSTLFTLTLVFTLCFFAGLPIFSPQTFVEDARTTQFQMYYTPYI